MLPKTMLTSLNFLADTWWFAATRMTPLQVQQLAKQRAKQGFTAIQLVAAFPPEVAPTSAQAANTSGWPLDNNNQINQSYFADLDKKIAAIIDAKLTPIIYGSWGNHIDSIGVETMCHIWQELIDRYSSLEVVWCVCGEVDLPPAATTLQGFPFNTVIGSMLRKLLRPFKNMVVLSTHWQTIRLEEWNRVGEYIAAHDPHHRPIIIHPHMNSTARQLFPQAQWLSANSMQSGHSRSRLAWLHRTATAAQTTSDPTINLEPWYEGIGGDFGSQLQRQAFWVSMLSGCLSYAYGAQGLWNMNKPGESFLGHWGSTDWRTAAAAPGAEQIGKAATWLREQNWFGTLQPVPLTAAQLETILEQPITAITPTGEQLLYLPTHSNFTKPNARFFDPTTMQELPQTELKTPDCIVLLPDSV